MNINGKSYDPYYDNAAFCLKASTSGAPFSDLLHPESVMVVSGNAQASTAMARFGQAAYFGDGTANYVKSPPTYQFTADADVAMSCWVYPLALPTNSYQGLCMISNSPTNKAVLLLAPSGVPWTWWKPPNGSAFAVSGVALKIGVWSYLCGVYRGDGIALYQDGVLVASNAYNSYGYLNCTGACISVGVDPNGMPADNTPFKGYIEDVVVVKRCVEQLGQRVPNQAFQRTVATGRVLPLAAGVLRGPDPVRPLVMRQAGDGVRRDMVFGGVYQLIGTVTEFGAPAKPVARRVRLIRERDGLPVRETWSDAAGHYAFTYIAPDVYTVVAYDHTHNYRAVIADNLLATPMGAGL